MPWIEHAFGSTFDVVDRRHELVNLQRSLAMLNHPSSPALSRQRAQDLITRLVELEDLVAQLRELLDRLEP